MATFTELVLIELSFSKTVNDLGEYQGCRRFDFAYLDFEKRS